jgi:hypothetical protein
MSLCGYTQRASLRMSQRLHHPFVYCQRYPQSVARCIYNLVRHLGIVLGVGMFRRCTHAWCTLEITRLSPLDEFAG